jgi:hypothetical protein
MSELQAVSQSYATASMGISWGAWDLVFSTGTSLTARPRRGGSVVRTPPASAPDRPSNPAHGSPGWWRAPWRG